MNQSGDEGKAAAYGWWVVGIGFGPFGVSFSGGGQPWLAQMDVGIEMNGTGFSSASFSISYSEIN